MKKLLSLFGSFTIISSSFFTTVSFINKEENNNILIEKTYGSPWVTNFVNKLQNDLAKVLTNTNLGSFTKVPSNEDILNRIKELNPEVDLNQIEILISNEEIAIISVKANSNVYLPSLIKVYFEIDKRIELLSVLTNTNLGIFAKIPTNEDILNRIKELNLEVDINQIGILVSNNQSALITVNQNSKVYFSGMSGLILVNFIIDSRPTLSSIIKKTNLGEFKKVPSNEDILSKVKELNPNLDLTQVSISNMTNTNATIRVIRDSKVYLTGIFETTLVNFTLDLRVDLKTVFKNTNLEIFKKAPTNQEILNKIKELNPNVDLTQISISNITNTNAIISVIKESQVYFSDSRGLVLINFIIDPRVDLSTAILIFDLNFIKFTNNQVNNKEILNKIKELNPNVDLTQISISNITNTNAIINVIKGSKVYFETNKITINFINDQRVSFKALITKHPTEKELKGGRAWTALTTNNPKLNKKELVYEYKRGLGIWGKEFIVYVKPGSLIYFPEKLEYAYLTKEIPEPW